MITGGSGQLGSEIIRQLRDAGRPFLAPHRAELDVTDVDQTKGFIHRSSPTSSSTVRPSRMWSWRKKRKHGLSL
ncbi:sugar nucleotide-binding protein [Rossellomorea sp. H39__3]